MITAPSIIQPRCAVNAVNITHCGFAPSLSLIYCGAQLQTRPRIWLPTSDGKQSNGADRCT